MHHNSRTLTLLVIATFSAASWLIAASEAQAQRSGRTGAHAHRGGQRATAISTRPAPRPTPRPQARHPRGPARPGVLSPGGLGSAANVRPGFYQQLNSPVQRGHGGHSVPIYIYPTYFPETYYPPAPAYSEPEPRDAPAPPPVYIVTPPVIAAPVVTAPPAPVAPPAPPVPRSTEPGKVKFSVLPADARVYLDDDYLGTGADLAMVEQASLFPPGVHVLEVTHPDFRPQRLVFGVSDTDPAHVLIDLSIDRVGRRTRVK